jgi:hypothetical protein
MKNYTQSELESLIISYQEELEKIQKDKMVYLSILVPESLRYKVKMYAARNKTNIKDFIIKYLEECVGEDKEKGND